jgi:hypothetical protein
MTDAWFRAATRKRACSNYSTRFVTIWGYWLWSVRFILFLNGLRSLRNHSSFHFTTRCFFSIYLQRLSLYKRILNLNPPITTTYNVFTRLLSLLLLYKFLSILYIWWDNVPFDYSIYLLICSWVALLCLLLLQMDLIKILLRILH